jgi:cytochrome c2
MTPRDVPLALLLLAVTLFVLATNAARARLIFSSIAFFVFLTAGLAFFSNWAPLQVRGEVPLSPPGFPRFSQKPIEAYTTKELADIGELIIFGQVGILKGQGKGQCPLCHAFRPGQVAERAPNLSGIVRRAAQRITEPRYLNPDTVQTESFRGSGRATTADEYIAESHICTNCYVAEGYGVKGSNDRESPMAADHLPPIGLNINEMIAVHTWLYVHDGETPPSPAQIRADHERFLPPGWHAADGSTVSLGPRPVPVVVTGADSPERMIAKLGCGTCHVIPTTHHRTGAGGPVLIAKTTTAARLASAEYQARVKAGKAHATTPKEYIIESIMHPSAYIPSPFVNMKNADMSIMPGYSGELTYEAADKLADFLLSIDESTAARDGITVDHEGRKGT